MEKFSVHRPKLGVTVWVWDVEVAFPEGHWRVAMLETSMYLLSASEEDRATWSFLGAVARKARPDDIWEMAQEPSPFK